MLPSLRSSNVGEMVSNALLKSNSKAIVTSFLSKPARTSSVNLSRAVVVLLCFLKPVWSGSRIPLRIMNSTIKVLIDLILEIFTSKSFLLHYTVKKLNSTMKY